MSLLPRTPRLWERLRWGMYETEARAVAEELSKFEKKTGDARSRSAISATMRGRIRNRASFFSFTHK